MVFAPGAAGVADQKACQAGVSESDQAVGIGVAGQQRQRGLAVVGSQRVVPGRAEQLQVSIEALKDRGAALDDRRADLDHPPQRLGRAVAGVLAQPLRMQQRQAGEQFGVQVVVFGVFGVVGTQGCGLGGRHHRDPGAALAKPRRDRCPHVAGRLHHHPHRVLFAQPEVGPQFLQLG